MLLVCKGKALRSVLLKIHCMKYARIRVFTDPYKDPYSIRTESTVLSLYGRIRVNENPYSRIFYAEFIVEHC